MTVSPMPTPAMVAATICQAFGDLFICGSENLLFILTLCAKSGSFNILVLVSLLTLDFKRMLNYRVTLFFHGTFRPSVSLPFQAKFDIKWLECTRDKGLFYLLLFTRGSFFLPGLSI